MLVWVRVRALIEEHDKIMHARAFTSPIGDFFENMYIGVSPFDAFYARHQDSTLHALAMQPTEKTKHGRPATTQPCS